MLNRREIIPAKSWLETQPSIELQASCCQNRFTGPPPILYKRMCSGQLTCGCKQVLSAPPLFLRAGAANRFCRPLSYFSKQDMCRFTHMWSSTAVNSAINQSDAFRSICRPIRDKLGSYGYAGSERIIYMLILFSQYIYNSFTMHT